MLTLASLALAFSLQDPNAAVEAKLVDIYEKANIPGISACVILPDGKEITVAKGHADSGGKVEMLAAHRFAGGSTGKMHFAVLAMSLVEQGKMALDDPISKYLGDEEWFKKLPIGEGATIKQFLNHTSGMHEHIQSPTFLPAVMKNPRANWQMKDALSHTFGKEPLFAPGEGWSYADSNYILAALAMEKASGKSAYEQISGLTIGKLMLIQTEPSTKLSYKWLANGQHFPGNPFGDGWALEDGKFRVNPQLEWAGGGFITSPRDLARLTRGIVNAKVISKESAALMMEGVAAKTGRDHEYGLGLMIRPSELGTTYGHSGWFPGYASDVQHFPEHGVTVAFQMNTDNLGALGMNYQMVAVELAKAALAD